jgi:hypothetical protein
MEDSVSLIKKSISALNDCKENFLRNEENIKYTSENLSLWLQNDMDKIIFGSRSEAQQFYQATINTFNKFGTEQIKFINAFKTANDNTKALMGIFYPDYKSSYDKYYDTIAQVFGNRDIGRFGNMPNIAPPSDSAFLGFYDRLIKIREEFNDSMYSYNQAVDDILKFKNVNHGQLLSYGIVRTLFSDNKSVLRSIFNALNVSKINIDFP